MAFRKVNTRFRACCSCCEGTGALTRPRSGFLSAPAPLAAGTFIDAVANTFADGDGMGHGHSCHGAGHMGHGHDAGHVRSHTPSHLHLSMAAALEPVPVLVPVISSGFPTTASYRVLNSSKAVSTRPRMVSSSATL